MIKLSILIPTIKRHGKYLAYLIPELRSQIRPYGDAVEILIDSSETDSIGEKRNRLLEKAKGEYISFVDADDSLSPKYISLLMEGIDKNIDCCSLKGIITTNGEDAHYFEHSIKYNKYKTNEGTSFEFGEIRYERFPNHISCLRASIAKSFKFPEKNWGEDTDWATLINDSQLLKTEHYISEVIYHYRYLTNKLEPMKYSQSDEGVFIDDFYSKYPSGVFMDIGAYDTYRFSNIRSLYETGKWSGVLVEPDPKNYKGLAENYANDERIKVLNIAIGATTGEIDFYESDGDAVSTSDIDHMKKWGNAGVKYTKIKVPQVSVEDFMNEYGRDVDFLNIDTESTNMVVFNAMPEWVWERISLLCIEHDGNQEEIENKLLPLGFTTLYTNAENIVLGKL